MTQLVDEKTPRTDEPRLAPTAPKRSHGLLIAVIALVIVIAIVVAGVVPRLRAKETLKIETDHLGGSDRQRGHSEARLAPAGNHLAGQHSGLYRRPDLCPHQRLSPEMVFRHWRAREERPIARGD